MTDSSDYQSLTVSTMADLSRHAALDCVRFQEILSENLHEEDGKRVLFVVGIFDIHDQ